MSTELPEAPVARLLAAGSQDLVTARLRLRRPERSDAEAIFAYASDPLVTRYLSWPTHRSLSDAHAFLDVTAKLWESGEELRWVITAAPGDAVVGGIGCRIYGQSAVIGYVLARAHWHRGYAAEAAKALVDWLGALPDIHRVWAYCDVANPASARVMEKAGMQREGLLRRWSLHPNLSSEPRDCLVYSRVRGDP